MMRIEAAEVSPQKPRIVLCKLSPTIGWSEEGEIERRGSQVRPGSVVDSSTSYSISYRVATRQVILRVKRLRPVLYILYPAAPRCSLLAAPVRPCANSP